MRLFAAIILPGELVKTIERYRDSLGRRIPYLRWTPLIQLHITPLFIGEVSEDELPALAGELRAVALHHASFTLTIQRVGYAPPGGRARMVWAYAEPSEAFARLTDDIGEGTCRANVSPVDAFAEEKEAHVTLARFDKRVAPPRELVRLPRSGAEGATIPVTEVLLMQSRLTPSGPLYTALHHFSLHGS